MSVIDKKINALAAYVLAEDSESLERARKELKAVLRLREKESIVPSDLETTIHEFLLEIGAPAHKIGYQYMVFAITQAILKPRTLDNMMRSMYPLIADHFDTTPTKAEAAIRSLIEKTFDYGDVAALNKYFRSAYSPDKDKPSNSQFLATAALSIRLKLKK